MGQSYRYSDVTFELCPHLSFTVPKTYISLKFYLEKEHIMNEKAQLGAKCRNRWLTF
uniref:Bm1521 n=1 Tax=Brugia malayi TaxID=6279 RepID=A0A1I9G555_BRUMA|nr:Bm1521 [Brugia malayi]